MVAIMNIIQNTISVGAEKLFTFLLISDMHLCETDERESAERRAFANDRKNAFSYAPSFMEAVRSYVKETGYPLFNTGGMQSNLIEQTVGSLNISSFLRSRTKAEQKFMKKIAKIYEDKAE